MSLESQKVDTAYLSRMFPSVFKAEKDIERVIPLAGDVSTRRYFRILTRSGSYVLQLADAFAQESSHPFLSMQKTLSAWGLPVPRLCGTHPAEGAILLEDLGDDMLHGAPSLVLYRQAIDFIAIWSKKSLSSSVGNDTLHFKQAFDFEKLNAEMKHTAQHLIEGLLNDPSGEYIKRTQANSRYLEARPRVLCHRDYHSKNLMLTSGSKLHVIDFQDARMGPITYDIVSLLWDPYVRLSETWKEELLSYWYGALAREGFDQIPEFQMTQFAEPALWREELERMKMQRLLKAIGTYAAFFRTRGRKDYLNCIAPTVSEICRSVDLLEQMKKAHADDLWMREYLKAQKWDFIGKL